MVAGTLAKNIANQAIPIELVRADGSYIDTTVGVTVTVALDTTTFSASGNSPAYTGSQLWYTPTQAETNGVTLLIRATHAEAVRDWIGRFNLDTFVVSRATKIDFLHG